MRHFWTVLNATRYTEKSYAIQTIQDAMTEQSPKDTSASPNSVSSEKSQKIPTQTIQSMIQQIQVTHQMTRMAMKKIKSRVNEMLIVVLTKYATLGRVYLLMGPYQTEPPLNTHQLIQRLST